MKYLLQIIMLVVSFGAFGQNKEVEKRGVVTIYWDDSELIHSKGKRNDNGKQGEWIYYSKEQQVHPVKMVHYKNDTLNGVVFEIIGDTINRIHYARGLKEGEYEQFRFHVESDTSDTLIMNIEKGNYQDGFKSGGWEYFRYGKLWKTGAYHDGKPSGRWKYYVLDNNQEPIIQSETYFNKGVKDGNDVVYFKYDSSYINVIDNPFYDEILQFEKIPYFHEYFYSKGEKNGPFVVKEDETIVKKGQFVKGELDGDVIERLKNGLFLHTIYNNGVKSGNCKVFDDKGDLAKEGAFHEDRVFSKWKFYKNNKLVREEFYNANSELNGMCYLIQGDTTDEFSYENGVLKSWRHYSQGKVKREYKVHPHNPDFGWAKLEGMVIKGDTTEYHTLELFVSDSLSYTELPTALMNNKGDDSKYRYNGSYEVWVSGKRLYSGFLNRGLKDGNWNFYFNSQIDWRVTFLKGDVVKELFTDKVTKEPFKGDYIVMWRGESVRFEFKIKDGVRNGKSYFYNEKGELIGEGKYKDGSFENGTRFYFPKL